MADYIPDADPDFNNWQTNFVSYLQTHQSRLGLSNAEMTSLIEVQSRWETAYEEHLNAQAAAQGARQQKDDSRQTWEQALRNQSRKLQSNENITNSDRATLGLTIPTGSRSTTGVPTSRPVVLIAETKPLSHTLRFFDENTPNRRAKPKGVMGAEVWIKIGDAPPNSSDDLQFLGLDTRTPYISEFDTEDGGKTAYYRLRWVNSKGEQGPWSDLVSASIAG